MSNESRDRAIHVVAGVLVDAQDRILLAQRPVGKELSGHWEFPGGKVEDGETRFVALARELREELGIVVSSARPLTRVRHSYPKKTVLLDFWKVRRFTGTPIGLDGQDLQWSVASNLESIALLPANKRILRFLDLPEEISASAGHAYEIGCRPLAGQVPGRLHGILCRGSKDATCAVDAGADFVLLTDRLPDGEVSELCAGLEVPVFIRMQNLQQAWDLGASGIHHLAGHSA